MSEGQAQLPVVLNQEYRVKLGKSFTFPKENAFHTIKYDFKPKSVDSSQPGRLKVEGEEVTVSLPLFQAESADDAAMFRGAKRPVNKECILIIDKVTGEAVLERINSTVQLKSVRDGSRTKKLRSVSPLPSQTKPVSSKPTPPPQPQTGKATPAAVTGAASRPQKPPKASRKPKEAKPHKVKETRKATTVSRALPLPPPPPPPAAVTQPVVTAAALPIATLPDSISPIASTNPTPEPGQGPPPVKKPRSHSFSSSSSSSSSSSKSDSASDSNESDAELDHQLGLSPRPPQVPQTSSLGGGFTLGFNIDPELAQPPAPGAPAGGGGSLLSVPSRSLSADSSSSSSSSSSSESDDESDSSSSSGSSDSSSEEKDEGREGGGGGMAQGVSDIATGNTYDASLSRPRSMSLLKEDLHFTDSDSD